MLMKRSLVILALLALISCERVEIPSRPVEDTVFHGMIELGERLEDPYSVDNITKAIESLYPSKAGRIVIEPTDLYMRFLPKTEEEYRRLEASVATITDHPLDYRIVREGDYYHDPSVPEGDITWQYVVVPGDYRVPEGIQCELIDKCYISEHDTYTRASEDIDWQEVEREAFRLTGNGDLLQPQTKADAGSPAGRITVVDPVLNEGKPFGVAEVMVVCNSFVKFAGSFTDRDGYYALPVTFSSEPRYRLVFKNRKGFSLGLNLVLLPASISTLGKGSPEGKDVCVQPTDDPGLYRRCVVNNSAYDYYTRCVETDLDIQSPPKNLSIWILGEIDGGSAAMLHQGVFADIAQMSEKLGKYADILNVFLPDITIGCKGLVDYYSIYSLTVHELAHASHYVQAGNDYWQEYIKYILSACVYEGSAYGSGNGEGAGYCEVGEVWAYFMESVLFKDRYGGSMPDVGTSYWFRPQILRYLYERGMKCGDIFKALKPSVCSMDDLQDELITLYPERETQIRQVFNRYARR